MLRFPARTQSPETLAASRAIQSKNIKVVYIDAFNELADVRKLIPYLKSKKVHSFEYIDTTDYWLEQRINNVSKAHNMEIIKKPHHCF